MWTELGITGDKCHVKNHVIHPLDESRKLYMFSDAPHLIKCVRNRLHDKKVLRVIHFENTILFYNIF